ncbi:MAG TPA: CvpA family protein [Candidatus Limnocylindrales bacterium]|nr:CvpA family protein [Candidatus Limnocylindrales bacterium]
MDVVAFIKSLNLFDLLVVAFLFGMFLLGYIQGAIRRVVGTLTITFSFFLAAQLSVPMGEFLISNWTSYPEEYSMMLGFLTLFVAGVVAFFLVVQGTYSKTEIFARHPVVDEVLGGVLGVAQGLLFLMFLTIVLDQYFLYAPSGGEVSELPFLRPFWTAVNASGFGSLLHETVIPNFVTIFGFLLPDYIKAVYAR